MACATCSCSGKVNLIEKFPEKRAALDSYLSSLSIGTDREQNRGLLIQSLHQAQEIFGYLPEEVQLYIAQRLHLHLSEVYGVVSFYSFFTDKPVGRYRISVCMGTACMPPHGASRSIWISTSRPSRSRAPPILS